MEYFQSAEFLERIRVAFFNSVILFFAIIIIGYLLEYVKKQVLRICCGIFGKTAGFFIVYRLTFLGTIHHELAHALFATLTGAKVTEMHLLTFSDGNKLGEVKFVARGNEVFRNIQFCLSALAPSICGAITLTLLMINFNIENNFTEVWQWILLIYVEISIFLHMTISDVDLKMAKKGMFTVIIIVFIIFAITGFDFLDFIQKEFDVNWFNLKK